MNIIEALKRSKETGERFVRAAWGRIHEVSYQDGILSIWSEDSLAEDWEPVPGTGDREKIERCVSLIKARREAASAEIEDSCADPSGGFGMEYWMETTEAIDVGSKILDMIPNDDTVLLITENGPVVIGADGKLQCTCPSLLNGHEPGCPMAK